MSAEARPPTHCYNASCARSRSSRSTCGPTQQCRSHYPRKPTRTSLAKFAVASDLAAPTPRATARFVRPMCCKPHLAMVWLVNGALRQRCGPTPCAGLGGATFAAEVREQGAFAAAAHYRQSEAGAAERLRPALAAEVAVPLRSSEGDGVGAASRDLPRWLPHQPPGALVQPHYGLGDRRLRLARATSCLRASRL